MSKASFSSTKYVILGEFEVDGYIEKPDLIGSFFGQTEGLIGDDLEFSQLQKAGKLGRIDIELKKSKGKSVGSFKIPTAVNKVEVSLVAAALESITKISHCTGKIIIKKIVDDREDKRKEIMKKAEKFLGDLKKELPESIAMVEDVSNKFKIKKVQKYANGEIFGGPDIEKQKEIILVEGRADVLNLLRYGINNVVCFNGSSIPKFISNLSKTRVTTAFLDDDRGGKLELEVLKDKINLDFYTFAPDSKEVEELNIKEIIKCLRNRKEVIFERKNVLSKVKKIFTKKLGPKSSIDKVNNKVLEFQNNVLYKKSDDVNTNSINKSQTKSQNKAKVQTKTVSSRMYLRKNELEEINATINNLLKSKDKIRDFMILDMNLKVLKTGNLNEFFEIKDLSKPKYLFLNGVVESSVLKKSKELGMRVVFCKRKSSKIQGKDIVIRLFDEVQEKVKV